MLSVRIQQLSLELSQEQDNGKIILIIEELRSLIEEEHRTLMEGIDTMKKPTTKLP